MLNIKEKIKSLKCMEGIIFYRKYRRDSNMRKILDCYEKKDIVLLAETPEKSIIGDRKNVYLIRMDSDAAGFFANWIWGLSELYYSDLFNLTPVIEWTKNCVYYEEKGVNGITNPFEYYFEPVSDISVQDAKESTQRCQVINSVYSFRNSYTEIKNINELVRINKKYMKIKKNIEENITKDINNLIGNKKTLAVHIRGVEWGNIQGHPVPLNLDTYIDKIDEALEKEKFDQIFLATDSDDTIEYLSNKYQNKIVFYSDVIRAKKGSNKLAIFDNSIKREKHHYLLGLEVLRDMMTLANCDGLIAGFSNISSAAEITKLSNNQKYKYKYIFNLKISQTGLSPKKAISRMKK